MSSREHTYTTAQRGGIKKYKPQKTNQSDYQLPQDPQNQEIFYTAAV